MWAKIAQWVGLNIILPILRDWAMGAWKKMKDLKNYKKESKEDQAKTEAYETKPSDETFGDAP